MAGWMRCTWIVLSVSLFLVPGGRAAAAPWRPAVDGLTFVVVEKKVRTDRRPPCAGCALPGSKALEPLPAAVLQRAGARAVQYEGFLTTWLPAPAARNLVQVARRLGLAAGLGIDREVRLPWHSFTPGNPAGRHDPGVLSEVPSRAVPRLFLIQFAYPVRPEWLATLEGCGAERLAWFQHRTLLVRAPSRPTLTRCAVAPYLSWIDTFRASDRVSPEILEDGGSSRVWLQYIHGTDLVAKVKELSKIVRISGRYESAQDRVAYVRVEGSLEDLRRIVINDPDLLFASLDSDSGPSDERQGQIVAGLHDGTALCPVGTTDCPHYREWLSERGLLSRSNQQVVAVIDLGYDDGKPPSAAIDHHPDLESPERLEGIAALSGFEASDATGHGTMVAGIIAGDGSAAGATQATDAEGFFYGSGIAPGAKIFAFDILGLFEDRNFLQTAFNHSRLHTDGTSRARIANQSWNQSRTDPDSGAFLPVGDYTVFAQFFDARVLDASAPSAHDPSSPARPGDQPMTVVFSAGNHAFDCLTQAEGWNSVSSPAVAKNVIAVGATESYRPAPEPPLACGGCFTADGTPNGRPPDADASHVGRVASFSGRGRLFEPFPAAHRAHDTRVKPDLVAPGVRVFSTVPYAFAEYDQKPLATGCAKYHSSPNPANTYHTYGTGTSFAAPVVSGVAALKRKWFLDRGVDPAPSLVKAALIATAESLGGQGLAGHDHRPSPLSGWGRVDLDRLTDHRPRQYVNASPRNAVLTGEARIYQFKAADLSAPVYIVLVWDDEPADAATNAQAPLVNDLALDLEGGTWRGNFFNENMTGTDDGFSYRFPARTWTHDTVNNVEAIFLPAGTLSAGQTLQVRVTGVNVPRGRASGRQSFSIYAYNLTAP